MPRPYSSGKWALPLLLLVVPLASCVCDWFRHSDAFHRGPEGCADCVTSTAFMASRGCVWCPGDGSCNDPESESSRCTGGLAGKSGVCQKHFKEIEELAEAEAERSRFRRRLAAVQGEQRETLDRLEGLEQDFDGVLKMEDVPAFREAMSQLLSNNVKNIIDDRRDLGSIFPAGFSIATVNKIFQLSDEDPAKAIENVFLVYFQQRAETTEVGPDLEGEIEGFKEWMGDLEVNEGIQKLLGKETVELSSEHGQPAFASWYLEKGLEYVKKVHVPCDHRGNLQEMEGGLFQLAEVGERENSDPATKRKIFILVEAIVSLLYIGMCFVPVVGPFISIGVLLIMKGVRKAMDFEGKEQNRMAGIVANKNMVRSMEAMTAATMVHYDHFVYPYAYQYSLELDDIYKRVQAKGELWASVADAVYDQKKRLLGKLNQKHKRIEGYSKTQIMSEEINWLHMLSESEGTRAVVRDYEKAQWWLETASIMTVAGLWIGLHAIHVGEALIAELAGGEAAVAVAEGAEAGAAAEIGAGAKAGAAAEIGAGAEAGAAAEIGAGAETGETALDAHIDHAAEAEPHGDAHGHHPSTEEVVGVGGEGLKLTYETLYNHPSHALHLWHSHHGHLPHGHHGHGGGHGSHGPTARARQIIQRARRTIMCKVKVRQIVGTGIAAKEVFVQLFLREANGHSARMRESINSLLSSSQMHDWSDETFQYAGMVIYFAEGESLLRLKVWSDKHVTVGKWRSRRSTKTSDSHKVGSLDVKLGSDTVQSMLETGRATINVDQVVCAELLNDHDSDECDAVGNISMVIDMEKDVTHLGDGAEMMNLDVTVKKAEDFPDVSILYNKPFVEMETLDLDSRETQSFETEPKSMDTSTKVTFNDDHVFKCVLLDASQNSRTSTTNDIAPLQSTSALEFKIAHRQTGKTQVDIGVAEFFPDWNDLGDPGFGGFLKGEQVTLKDSRNEGYLPVQARGQGEAASALAEQTKLFVEVKAERVDVEQKNVVVHHASEAVRKRFAQASRDKVDLKDSAKQLAFSMRLLAAMWYSGVAGFTQVNYAKETQFVSADRLQHAVLEVIESGYTNNIRKKRVEEGRARLAQDFSAHSWESLFDAATTSLHAFKIRVQLTGDDSLEANTITLDGILCEAQPVSNYAVVNALCDVTDAKASHLIYVKAKEFMYQVLVEPQSRGLLYTHSVDVTTSPGVQKLPRTHKPMDSLTFPSPYGYLSRPPPRDPESEMVIVAYFPFDGEDIAITKQVVVPSLKPKTAELLYADGWVKVCDTGALKDDSDMEDRPRGQLLVNLKYSPVRTPVGWEHVAAIPDKSEDPHTQYTSMWVADPPPGYRCFGSVVTRATLENVLDPPPLSSVGCVPVAASTVWDMQNTKSIKLLDHGKSKSGDALAQKLKDDLGSSELIDAKDFSEQEFRMFRGPAPLHQLVATGHDTSARFPTRAVFTLREGHYKIFPTLSAADYEIEEKQFRQKYFEDDGGLEKEDEDFADAVYVNELKRYHNVGRAERAKARAIEQRKKENFQKEMKNRRIRNEAKFMDRLKITRGLNADNLRTIEGTAIDDCYEGQRRVQRGHNDMVTAREACEMLAEISGCQYNEEDGSCRVKCESLVSEVMSHGKLQSSQWGQLCGKLSRYGCRFNPETAICEGLASRN